jgi:superoxide dismutase, Fe-Mn family
MAVQQKYDYQLPDLEFDFNALEPVISAEIMELHYSKHHKAYVTKLNEALEEYQTAEAKKDVPKMIALQSAIKFNGGGHINHSIFWAILSPEKKAGKEPTGALKQEIDKRFGSFEAFKELFNKKTGAIQGSGWGWLGYNKADKKVEIETCQNQDPLSTKGLIPIMGVDVWEHAYYLQYKNARPEYLKAIWAVLDWKKIEDRFQKVSS